MQLPQVLTLIIRLVTDPVSNEEGRFRRHEIFQSERPSCAPRLVMAVFPPVVALDALMRG